MYSIREATDVVWLAMMATTAKDADNSAPGAADARPPAPPPRLSLAQMNALPDVDFRRIFSNVVECCPEVAVALATQRPFSSVGAAAQAAADILEALPEAARRRVLLLHPDLAGRLAQHGLLTAESQREQQAAGVLRLDPERAQRLALLNTRYRERFGFPYVVCAREKKSSEQILEDLQQRVERSREDELRTGIDEVKKICRLRLQELVADD
ncbi:hypothetical protein R5R35_007260 [Gryllus longicercus]|uniref:2-oxo-4-hydroxy-4-carboxy-5-ureidoimidazoline decarboxylase n=1 Tax=Gryllus longicercus TaxID=2509291 RepID=A0AAN9WBU5_9ORTH